MNKIFKVIWSKARNCYIVVSELAKNHDTGHTSRIRGGLLAASLMLSLSCPMYGFAESTMPTTFKYNNVDYTLGSSSGLTGIYYDGGSKNYVVVTYQDDNYTKTSSVIPGEDQSGTVDEKGNVVYGEGNPANGYGNIIYGKSNSADPGTSSDPGQAVVIGVNNKANGNARNSTIIGQSDIVSSPNTVAIGNQIQENSSSEGGTVIIGNYAHSDSSAGGSHDTNRKYIPAGIILGEYSFSRPSANTKEAYLKPSVVSDSNKDYWKATWTPTAKPVSIGDVVPNNDDGNASGGNGHGIITRQINGVAAGSYDTDAVNVAQLKQAIAKFRPGGEITVDSVHYYSVNSSNKDPGSNYNNDGAAGYTDAMAAGVRAKANGNYATAVGNGAQALANSAVAIGDGAVANGVGATVIGKHAQATGEYATAFGGFDTYVNTASGNSSTAFGQGAQARGVASLAFGHNTIAGEEGGGGQQSVAFGEDTQALGGRSLAFGEKTVAKYNDSVAFGNESQASSTGATAFGNRTRALAQYSTAWGNATVAADEESTAWGTDTIAGAKLDENGAVINNYKINPKDKNEQVKQEQMDVHGNLAYIQNGSTVGVKQMDIGGNTEKHDYVVLAGQDGNTYVRDYQGSLWRVKVSADGKTAKVDTTVGENGKVYNNNSKAGTVGSKANTTISGQEVAITPDSVLKKAHEGTNGYDIEGYKDATAFGYSTEASGDYATAFGNDTQAKATGATAFGNKSQATGRYATSFGYSTEASGKQATAFGSSSTASGDNATAFGENSTASGEAATAFGIGSTASGKNSLAVGGAEATLEDSIALGKNSKTTRAKYSELTSDAEAYGKTSTDTGKSAWEATENAIAVGNDSTTTRQITGVAAGSLDTDAVNVAQLKRLNENLSGQHTIVTVGNQSVSADNTPVTGGNLDLTRKTATNGQATYDLSLDRHVTLGEQAKDKGGSLTVNNVAYKSHDTDGNPLPDSIFGEAVKIDGKTVSVVKQDGESDQHQVVLGIDQDAGGYVTLYNSTGKPTYIYNAISPGITYLKDKDSYLKPDEFGRLEYKISNDSPQFIATLDDGQKYAGDNYSAPVIETTDGKTTVKKNVITKKLNERLDIQGGADKDKLTTNNIGVNVVDGVLKVQLAQNINLGDNGSVKMGDTFINNSGVTITKKDGNKTTTVSLTDAGLNNGNNKIINVAGGVNGTDAVNMSQLNNPNHTIKYYSVDETKLSKLTNFMGNDYSNEKNDGAKNMGSMAAGFNTHADGIISTVAGSYSGVINQGHVGFDDLRGATALSYGTFNINMNTEPTNTATTKTYSGVANSIIGQANITTDSNAAIIYGAGNTVTNSYRPIDDEKAMNILENATKPQELIKALRDAVPTSGGQVMVLGGGNSVDNAYMTQVNGVGNTVTGTSDEGKYSPADSTQFNYIEGFYTNLTNGKNDYIIGAHNNVTGNSVADNQSNIVFGDNHTLTNTKNNVILGSADATDKAKTDTTTVSDVVSIGHNAKVSAEGGVAIGSGSEATVVAGVAGYDPTTGKESQDPKAA